MIRRAVVLVSCSVLPAGCSSGDDRPEVTPPALAAAVVAHYDGPLKAATALVPGRDAFPYAPPGSTGTEVVLGFPDDANVHIDVLVSEKELLSEYERSLCQPFECVDVGASDVEARLVWEPEAPEEDPGVLYGFADTGEHFVRVTASGPAITEARDSPELIALGEAVTAILLDPAVAPRTSEDYAADGRELCAGDAWLDWYGQDNGSADPPRGYVDWCADAG